jgi:hypothetical protein
MAISNAQDLVDSTVATLQANGGSMEFADLVASWSEDDRRFYVPQFKALETEYGQFRRQVTWNAETSTISHPVTLAGA